MINRIKNKIVLSAIIMLMSGIHICAQEIPFLDISLSYGFMQSFEKNNIEFGYGKFTEEYTREGNVGGVELIYNSKTFPLQIGYSLQTAGLNSFFKEISGDDIRINKSQNQEVSVFSNGLVLRYCLRNNSMFEPFFGVTPSYKYYNYNIDTLSFRFVPNNYGTTEGIPPEYIDIVNPSFEASFSAIGIKPELGINMVLQNGIGFQVKAGYDIVMQNETELISKRLDSFSFQLGLLYRFTHTTSISE